MHGLFEKLRHFCLFIGQIMDKYTTVDEAIQKHGAVAVFEAAELEQQNRTSGVDGTCSRDERYVQNLLCCLSAPFSSSEGADYWEASQHLHKHIPDAANT
jgi:hypothetical protein